MGMQGLSPAGNPLIPVLQDPGAVRDMVGMQGISPAGNPLIPVLQDPGAGREAFLYGSASPIQGHRKRSYHEQFSRPRSNSMSGVPIHPVYGSVSDAPPPPPSGTAPPHQQQRLRSEKWSPRSEIMSLTKGFNSRRSSPPISPNMNAGNNYRSMSPRRSPSNAALRAGHMTRHDGVHVKFSSSTNLDHPFSATASTRGIQPWQHEFDSIPAWESDSLLGTGGGEAAFYGKNRGKRSNRKMHMRQRSAQLFMEDIKGVQQPPVCRDVLFVLLFLFHLVGIVYLGTTYGSEATERDQAVTLSYHNVTYMACLCGAFAVIVSTIALVIVMTITKKIIQLALFLTIALSFAWGTIGIGLSPKNFVPITGIIALALSVGYAFVVWDRIPFAAANLHAGLRAVRANMGIVLVAFIFQGLALGWTIYYTFVVVGVYDALDVGDLVLTDKMKVFVYSMLGISFYWTFHVLMNIVQVTVAGTLGSWWFKPDAAESSYWNQSTSRALFSALFYSIGSICFGSLLIGPVRFIRQLSAFVRPTQGDSILMCLHEFVNCVQQCIANCVDNLSDHFNPWALTYVGLYGYGLLDAGHNATDLFEKRGWTTIVSDDLVANVLLMFSIVVGGVTGCFGILLQGIDELEFSSFHEPIFTAFVIGLGVGLVLTSVLFAIISSSVNAVIVCFAGSPLEFEQNHPELSAEMRAAWGEVWPGCMDDVDMRVGFMAGGPLPAL